MTRTTQCAEHGQTRMALACQHLVRTLEDEIPRGAWWSRGEDGCINGYCGECAQRFEAAGGEWVGEAAAQLDVQVVCEGCFRRIASINGFSELD